jgi:hypothetical protein
MIAHPHDSKRNSHVATAARLSIYDGQQCIGFVLPRGKVGFEAFDRDEQSLGRFETQAAAAAAIHPHTKPAP